MQQMLNCFYVKNFFVVFFKQWMFVVKTHKKNNFYFERHEFKGLLFWPCEAFFKECPGLTQLSESKG